MEWITPFLDMFLHIDRYLVEVVHEYGVYVYALLFIIVFCETGLVVFPFLPGDSLLFVAGTLAGAGTLDAVTLGAVFLSAAILGDAVNYAVGRYAGSYILNKPTHRFIKIEHLQKTQTFYERHGGKTIIIARFLPIIRTFAPFVAGLGAMPYPRFFAFNIIGAIIWVVVFVGGGILFGEISWVKQNITLIALLIVVVSLMPGLIHFLMARRRQRDRS